MSVVNRYNFFLNTAQSSQIPASAGSPSYSNCSFIVSHPSIELTDEHNHFQAQIISCCIPFSFNIINTNNNVIYNCVITISGTPHTFNLTVPKGNYNITQLTSTFSQLLNAQYKVYEPSGTSVINILMSQTEGFVDYTITLGNTDSSLSVYLPYSLYPFIGKMMGFVGDITFSNTTSNTSTIHYNVSPYQQLYIRSSQLLSRNYEFINGVMNPSDIICSLNLYTSFDSYLNTNNLNPLISYLTIKSISIIDIYLTNDIDFIPIDLRGIPMYLQLLIEEISPIDHTDNDTNIRSIRNELGQLLKNPGEIKANQIPNEPNSVEKEVENSDIITKSEQLENLKNALSELEKVKK